MRRVNYGEADRIITFLTKSQGKIGLMAKGVRREKSKLAGGIELFSESEITVLEGKGSLDVLISARLKKYFKNIVSDYDRINAGYQVIKYINKLAEDGAGSEFYELLLHTFSALDDLDVPVDLVEGWYKLNILKLMGSEPDLSKDSNGRKLSSDSIYTFDFKEGTFKPDGKGGIDASHIKTWRLMLANRPEKVAKVSGVKKAIDESLDVIGKLYEHQLG